VQLNVERSSKTVARISFSIPAEEFEKEYRNGLRQMRQRVRMKGFRPGKAPLPMIEKQHGEELRRDVQQFFLRKAYSQAVEQEELRPIAHPRVPLEDAALAEDGSFALEFDVSLRPEVNLPEYKGLVIESELEPVMEANVEAALDELRRQQSRPEPAVDGIDAKGLVLCSVAFLHAEREAPLFDRDGLRLASQTPPPGVEPELFAEKMLGAKDGDVIELEMSLPQNIEEEELRGQPGTCRITVTQALNLVPPTDEELCALLEADDVAAMNAKVKVRLEEAAAQREEQRIETALLDRAIGALDLELPEPVLEDQTDARLKNLASQMLEQGVPEEELEQQLESQRATARDEAAKGLKALLLIEAIGDAEELLVTNEELEAELASIAERNETSVDEVRKYYSENSLGQQMAVELLERKVRRFLRQQAEVKAPS
jgi:trigger factor